MYVIRCFDGKVSFLQNPTITPCDIQLAEEDSAFLSRLWNMFVQQAGGGSMNALLSDMIRIGQITVLFWFSFK